MRANRILAALHPPLQINSQNLAPGQTIKLSLLPQSNSQSKGVRIVPDWAPGNIPIWLGFRDRNGGAAWLLTLSVLARRLPGAMRPSCVEEKLHVSSGIPPSDYMWTPHAPRSCRY